MLGGEFFGAFFRYRENPFFVIVVDILLFVLVKNKAGRGIEQNRFAVQNGYTQFV